MTVEKLRNMNVKIRGYAMPDDNAPCFYKRCKLSEAMEIMRDYIKDIPEDFYNYKFNITDEEDEFLFTIRREFDKVYFGCVNKYNLTADIARAALGLE